ncbi:MAG: DNA polymerase ligase N-terminal domain-containing protein [Elusimicrobiota bacterium]
MSRFFVQEHHARHLHWDFRLEVGGVLKSWALPKGPSMDPDVKRLALQTPDHALDYGPFEGSLPEGSYGAGLVLVWDTGDFRPPAGSEAVEAGLRRGVLDFVLHGSLLKGGFSLIRMKGAGRPGSWLLVKKNDSFARRGWKAPVLLRA